jgi:hypothetical protein
MIFALDRLEKPVHRKDKNYSSVQVYCKGGTCKTKGFNLIGETCWSGLNAGMRESFDTLLFQ